MRRSGQIAFLGFNTLGIAITHRGPGPSLATIGLVAVVVVVPVIAAVAVVALGGWGRRALRRRHAHPLAPAEHEARARALMSELCPHGWRAQITLFGRGDELPPGAPSGERSQVALDWAELGDEDGRIAIVRRVWAPTVAEALDAMVADRLTDETLEQIERSVSAWPEG